MSTNQVIEPSSPLYLHPSDGPTSVMVDKLQGTNNYRAWRRDMEQNLAAKRKLGFVTGELRRMKAFNIMPSLAEMNPEITTYVHALQNHQEEQRLFQFLSGLDESYSHQRSQVQLMVKLHKINVGHARCVEKEAIQLTTAGLLRDFPLAMKKRKKKDTGNKSLNTKESYGSDKEEGNKGNTKWNKGKNGGRKMAAKVKPEQDEGSSSVVSGSAIIAQRCNLVNMEPKDRIINSGATHYMFGKREVFHNLREKKDRSTINLPNRETLEVRGIGDVRLNNGMTLKNVLQS
ncbi:DNA polymerase 1 [Bienertia sinuspersici]